MLINYLKSAWRSIHKNKLTSFINVLGLAIGMSCALLIYLWIKDERSYNNFIPNASDVFGVRINAPFNGDVRTLTQGPGPLEDALIKDVPEIQYATKLGYSPGLLFRVGSIANKENGRYVTKDFFRVFPLPVIEGDANAAIASIDRVVITRQLAKKYFNTTRAAGRSILLDNNKSYIVGAVIEDLPANSTIQFTWAINFKVIEQDWMKTWGNISFPTYVRLRSGTTQAQTEAAMKNLYPRNAPEGFAENYPFLQPLTDEYLYAKYENGKVAGGRIEYVRIFGLVAAFILLIACINFMNLATARASLRAREVGVRKATGAPRSALIAQFMIEAFLSTALATIVALLITTIILPAFNQVFQKHITLDVWHPSFWWAVCGFVIVTSLVAGSYPAIFLSSLKPARVLKGEVNTEGGNTTLVRKSLVVLQFSLSVFLIVGMLAVAQQVRYIQNKNLGLDRDHMMYIPMEGDLYMKLEAYQNTLNALAGVAGSCPMNSLPMDLQSNSGDFSWPGKPDDQQTNIIANSVGYGFSKTLNAPLVAGRDFSPDYHTDSMNYVVNEATLRMMGVRDGVGKQVKFWNGTGTIIGVLKDFHMTSLHQQIQPLILCLTPSNIFYMVVRLKAGHLRDGLAAVEKVTKTFNPAYPFEYHFADETYEAMYRSEMQTSALVKYFGGLAIVISCLGLFGMASFAAERRTREVSIRKVLGASISGIVAMLSTEMIRLVIISLVIALPLVNWAARAWLDTFEYKTSLGIWIFAGTATATIIMAWLTISFHTVRAAIANPVEGLRNE